MNAYNVFAGLFDIQEVKTGEAQLKKVEKVILHPHYSLKRIINDIGLIKVCQTNITID